MRELFSHVPAVRNMDMLLQSVEELTQSIFVEGCYHVYLCCEVGHCSGHLRNCSFWHLSVGFICQPCRLLLGGTAVAACGRLVAACGG